MSVLHYIRANTNEFGFVLFMTAALFAAALLFVAMLGAFRK